MGIQLRNNDPIPGTIVSTASLLITADCKHEWQTCRYGREVFSGITLKQNQLLEPAYDA
jgi:hypothetical protein